MIDLTISIVNYNQAYMLIECIKSIYKETSNISFEIIVVDNASTDDSVSLISSFFPEVIIIKNSINMLFSKAHNQAIRISKGKYICLLNNDTIILDRAIEKLINVLDTSPLIGICGPKLLNKDLSNQHSCIRFPTFTYLMFELLFINNIFPYNKVNRYKTYYGWNQESSLEVDCIAGSCMVFRKDLINKIGLLDENYPLYFEESDLCRRIKCSNYKVYYYSNASIIHLWGVTTSKFKRKEIEYYTYQSMLYYAIKYFSKYEYSFIFYLVKLRIKLNTLINIIKRRD